MKNSFALPCVTLIALSVLTLAGDVAASETRSPDSSDPAVVSRVDLHRYSGLWHEIAHNPTFFQRFCDRSTAQYGVLAGGEVSVLNTCYRNNQVWSSIEGKAAVVRADEPAKLIVDFGWFRRGDYWIVDLDKNYEWAVVSGAGKKSLFILARKAPMEKALLESIVSKLNDRGFDTSQIVFDKY